MGEIGVHLSHFVFDSLIKTVESFVCESDYTGHAYIFVFACNL